MTEPELKPLNKTSPARTRVSLFVGIGQYESVGPAKVFAFLCGEGQCDNTHLMIDCGDQGHINVSLAPKDAEFLARQLTCPQPSEHIEGIKWEP